MCDLPRATDGCVAGEEGFIKAVLTFSVAFKEAVFFIITFDSTEP